MIRKEQPYLYLFILFFIFQVIRNLGGDKQSLNRCGGPEKGDPCK